MKRFIALALALILALSLCACGKKDTADEPGPASLPSAAEAEAPAEAPAEAGIDADTLLLGTGGSNGVFYKYGAALASYLTQSTDLTVRAVETLGSEANLDAILAGDCALGIVQSDVLANAYRGVRGYDAPRQGFRALGALYAKSFLIVTCDDDLTSIVQLAGRSLCVGLNGSDTYYAALDILEASGVDPNSVTFIEEAFSGVEDRLSSGEVDAAIVSTSGVHSGVAALAEGGAHLLAVGGEAREDLLWGHGWYAEGVIPAGTYAGVEEDVPTVVTKAVLVASADLDDDTAYAIVSTLFENADDVAALHAKGAELDPAAAARGAYIPFAEGAARYLAEQGVTVGTEDFDPAPQPEPEPEPEEAGDEEAEEVIDEAEEEPAEDSED